MERNQSQDWPGKATKKQIAIPNHIVETIATVNLENV